MFTQKEDLSDVGQSANKTTATITCIKTDSGLQTPKRIQLPSFVSAVSRKYETTSSSCNGWLQKCAKLVKSTPRSTLLIVCLSLAASISLFILLQSYLSFMRPTSVSLSTPAINRKLDERYLQVYQLNVVNSTLARRSGHNQSASPRSANLFRFRRSATGSSMHWTIDKSLQVAGGKSLDDEAADLDPVASSQEPQSVPQQQQQRSSYSANNRGSPSMTAPATNTNIPKSQIGRGSAPTSSESRWTPIVKQTDGRLVRLAGLNSPAAEHQPHVSNSKPSNNVPDIALSSSNHHQKLVNRTSVQHNRVRPNRVKHKHQARNNVRPHHRQVSPKPAPGLVQSASFATFHWRRPRFHGPDASQMYPMAQGKIYKRVLLCDKTLVSLDYLRRSPAGNAENIHFRPMNHYASNEIVDEFTGDNFIDLDGNYALDSVNILDRRQSPNSPTTTTNETIVSAPSHLQRRSINPHNYNHHHDNGYLLPDDEPLVKCDMWDLEKGLKNRKPPLHILSMAVRADFDTVRDAINRCRQLSERTLPPEDEYRGDGLEIMSTEDLMSLFSMKRGLLPGTKWCGLGDQADSYNDLGPKHRIDICCRAHDHCPIRSKPFRNDYGVLNIGLYTKSHCDCDADFYRCLREARSRTADMLGNLYFNVMKLQCMREERMKICREVKPIALGFERCIRYEDSNLKRVFKFTSPPVAY